MMPATAQQNLIVRALVIAAMIGVLVAFFVPIWWVSLTAPNYPKDAFPDGIRIHFHFNGVFNGCTSIPKGSRMAGETLQEDLSEQTRRYNPILDKHEDVNKDAKGLDCLHEMNTINHYVGMYPIETGAPVERPLAKFFFGFFLAMLAAFLFVERRAQLIVLGAGFAGVAAWMVTDLFVMGHLKSFVDGYTHAAGTFFKEPEKIAAWGEVLTRTITAVAIGLIGAMLIIFAGVWKWRGFSLLLALVPALLPLYFVLDYAGWLWFFGHNLHPWGAFTVKPFMPTVFGEGKVAQFSTFSYPHWGYAVLIAIFLLLMLALLLRRRQLREP
jgi:hypothetical protein